MFGEMNWTSGGITVHNGVRQLISYLYKYKFIKPFNFSQLIWYCSIIYEFQFERVKKCIFLHFGFSLNLLA